MGSVALSQAEKEKVVEWVGWPTSAVKEDTIFYNTRLDKFYLSNLSEETETRVRTFITRIDNIETQKEQAISTLKVHSISGIRINDQEIQNLNSLKYQYSMELRDLLGIPQYR